MTVVLAAVLALFFALLTCADLLASDAEVRAGLVAPL
ncbi:MAG: hypothetical protein QOJ68_1443 [Blastococcus sp.]|jgi:hypothetical protein|nr:hypothetical protein [Blastococcus sp.]